MQHEKDKFSSGLQGNSENSPKINTEDILRMEMNAPSGMIPDIVSNLIFALCILLISFILDRRMDYIWIGLFLAIPSSLKLVQSYQSGSRSAKSRAKVFAPRVNLYPKLIVGLLGAAFLIGSTFLWDNPAWGGIILILYWIIAIVALVITLIVFWRTKRAQSILGACLPVLFILWSTNVVSRDTLPFCLVILAILYAFVALVMSIQACKKSKR
jgi:hypothetical protein